MVIDDAVVMDKDKKVTELKSIDINDTSLRDGKTEDINPDADAWGRPAPPPDGVYKVKLFLAKQAFQLGQIAAKEGEKIDPANIYYVGNLECKIQEDEKWKDSVVFGKVSTYIGAGKEINTMAGMIRKFGMVVPNKITHLELTRLFHKCLKKEPSLYCEGEWKAWDTHKEEWIKVGMKNFSKKEDGSGYNHVIRNSKGEQVNAGFKINRWYGLKEYRQMMEREIARKTQGGGINLSGGANMGGGKKEVVGEEFADIETSQSLQVAAVGNKKAQVQDDDFVLDE
jgi:hypothetical protein